MSETCKTLSIKALSVKIGREQILDNIDITGIAAKQIVAFAGPNGAGKSTLLKAIAGIVSAKGIVSWNDENILEQSLELRSRIIGYMPQTINSTSQLTVLESLIASLHFIAPEIPLRLCESRAIDTLSELGLLHLAMKQTAQLSGGERQLTSLAQSLVREPQILLLDEPTSALDLRHQVAVMTILRKLSDKGKVVIVVLHDLVLAANWSDKLVFIADGKAAVIGKPKDVLTPALLQEVYGVKADIEYSKQGKAYLNIHGLV